MALRLNESSIKMDKLEKGKVIYELAKKTKKRPGDIGKRFLRLKIVEAMNVGMFTKSL